MTKHLRKVIRIRAEDSPNVQHGLEQKKKGEKPTEEQIIPGVLGYNLYEMRRATWDAARQSVGLDGEFYEGATNYLFPAEWINLAEQRAEELEVSRPGKAMGVDTAEGGDDTSWAIIDSQGLIELISEQTPDTNVIPGKTIALMQEYDITPENVLFDSGGGGSVHADRLKAMGYGVQTVYFGGSPVEDVDTYFEGYDEKKHRMRNKYTYKNKRAQMYHGFRLRLDPNQLEAERKPFAIPARFEELRRQLAPIPLQYDEEGRIFLLPKQAKPGSDLPSLTKLIGRSPDDADAVVMAVYALKTDNIETVSLGPEF